MWGKRNTNALLVGVQEGTAALDFSVVICQKIRKKNCLTIPENIDNK